LQLTLQFEFLIHVIISCRCPANFTCILWPWKWSNPNGICWMQWTGVSFGKLHPFHCLLFSFWGCWCPLPK